MHQKGRRVWAAAVSLINYGVWTRAYNLGGKEKGKKHPETINTKIESRSSQTDILFRRYIALSVALHKGDFADVQ